MDAVDAATGSAVLLEVSEISSHFSLLNLFMKAKHHRTVMV